LKEIQIRTIINRVINLERNFIMFVCICKGITDHQIKQLVTESGVGSIRELKQHLPLGSQCGTCVKVAQNIIDNTIMDESLFKEVG
jgi:bacterioferritin-associated ferredoxin